MESSAAVPAVREPAVRIKHTKKLPVVDTSSLERRFKIRKYEGSLPQWLFLAVIVGGSLASVVAGLTALAAYGVGAVAFVGFLGKLIYDMRRFNRKNAIGINHLARGELQPAMQTFDKLTGEAKRWKSVAVYNYGIASIAHGDVDVAAMCLTEVRESKISGLKFLAPAHLATALALLGELDSAEAWVAEFERRAQNPRAAHLVALRALPRGIIALRQGNTEAAAAVFDDEGRAASGKLETAYSGVLNAVWAFTLASAGRRQDKRFVALIADLDADGQLDHLHQVFAHWPEARQFIVDLQQNELSPTSQESGSPGPRTST